MYILGYKSEDENGYEYIDNIIGIYSNKEYAEEEIENQIRCYSINVEKKLKRVKKEKELIKEFVVKNYDEIIRKGVKHATLRGGDKEAIIIHLTNNPGLVHEVIGVNCSCPRYKSSPYHHAKIDRSFFLIKMVEFIK